MSVSPTPPPSEPDGGDPDTEPLNISVWDINAVLAQDDSADVGWPPVASGERLTIPHSPSRPRWVVPAVAAGALAVVAVVVVLVAHLISRGASSGSADDQRAAPAVSAASDPVRRDQLMKLLPRGYGPGVCHDVAAPAGAGAAVECGPNADAPGTTARFVVFMDAQALRGALDAAIAGMTVVVCPGNYQSPGPWRRGSAPTVVVGTLVCGVQQGQQPVLAWSVEADRLLAVIRSDPQGPTLSQLYTWWSAHS